MPSFKITLAYDGTDLVGWQRQAAGTSVQGLLEDALGVLDGNPVAVIGAGRTDAGAHALGQVASFSVARGFPPDRLVAALNAHLPHSVRVLAAEPVSDAFHARFHARSKAYRYRIWQGDVISPFDRHYAWHLSGPLNVDDMAAAARFLEGRHDFAAFQAAGSAAHSTERDVFRSRVESLADPRQLVYEIQGSGFLRHMVRSIVGSLVEVGRGRRSPEWIDEVLRSRDRRRAGPTAPPLGLFLVGVSYDA